jgi:hypothetical protein
MKLKAQGLKPKGSGLEADKLKAQGSKLKGGKIEG